MMRNIKDNSQYNIVVLGDIRAGKTTLVSQYIFNTVRTSYKPTIEDCYRTLARLPDGKYKTVNVVDTAGSMEFPAMRELRIRSATAIIIVYNVNDSVSINSASELKRQVQKMREYDGVPISIVGNLTDSRSSLIQYQIPVGVMEDSTCEHYYINLTDYQQCKKFFDGMIEKCYETNTWKVEVWAVTKTNEEKNSGRKKRGLLQYISFRRKKGPNVHTRAVKSLP